MNVDATIRGYLPQIIHMSLATSVDNKPWVCELHYCYDDQLNLYFLSLTSRRHSREMAQNSNVAGNIVTQHGLSEAPQGVYFEGIAELLTGVTAHDLVYKLYCERFGTGPEIIEESATPVGHQFYKITVSDWYMYDSRGSKPSTKYHWKRKV